MISIDLVIKIGDRGSLINHLLCMIISALLLIMS